MKRWPGWVALLIIVVIALAIGSTRRSGPLTQEDRADGIAQRLACPTCEGESVYESKADAADDIRQQIRKFIEAGKSDNEIINYLVDRNSRVLLVPRATGFDSLVWIVPVFALICAIAGLTVAFRRWKAASDTVPTDDDRALVAAALQTDPDLP